MNPAPKFQQKMPLLQPHYKAILLSSSLFLTLPACTTLPKQQPQPVEYAFNTPTEQTTLAKIVLPLREQNPDLTGYHLLYDPLEALAARIELINKAEKSLDLQYYIWHDDLTGNMLGRELLAAADRGVFIRILLDDMNTVEKDIVLSGLAQHPYVEIRLFNPIYSRRNFVTRTVEMLFRGLSLNRRMHNKSFIADNQIALIGGRNMSNQYYNVSEIYQFSDVDVMLVGAASDEIIHSFDEYWNDDYAYPVQEVVNPRHHAISAWASQVHGETRFRSRVVRPNSQAS